MVITYRYNMISECNLELLNLKTKLNTVQSNLAATAMNVEQNTDLSKVEAIAKQKLGMQKPDKNQVVYIDTSKDSNIIKENNTNIFQQVVQKIKEFVNNIK
ncbi:MAG: cell division protein FtsL [Clostridia bacterium]